MLVHILRRQLIPATNRSLVASSCSWGRCLNKNYSPQALSFSSYATPIATEDEIQLEVEEANEKYGDKMKIVQAPMGYGVIAQTSFEAGDLIVQSKALETDLKTRDSHTIQKDFNSHIHMDLPARFINHSCGPNVGISSTLNKHGSYDFIALETIAEGDELAWDYESSEYDMEHKFDCQCGAPNCRGTIKGYKFNGPIVSKNLGENHIAAYLQEG